MPRLSPLRLWFGTAPAAVWFLAAQTTAFVTFLAIGLWVLVGIWVLPRLPFED